MTSPLFWCPDLRAFSGNDTRVTLPREETAHAAGAKRIVEGEHVLLSDGSGCVASGRARVTGREVRIDCDHIWTVEAPRPRLVAIQSAIKGDRMELAVELLTEAGADDIVVVITDRSQVRLDTGRRQRWQTKLARRAREASKQARRAWFPRLHFAQSLGESLDITTETLGAEGVYFLDTPVEQSLASHLGPIAAAAPTKPADATPVTLAVAIGPEGGWSDSEQAEARTRPELTPVHLGPTILRASTAGCVAIMCLSAATGRHEVTHWSA